jgi:hypothetical protein
MTRALVAAVLITHQILVWTCPALCRGALQHEAVAVTEPAPVSGHEHHSHGHEADAPDGTATSSLEAIHDGCEDCATPPAAMWSVTPKLEATTPSLVLAFVTTEPDSAHLVSHAAADEPLRDLFPDSSPPGQTHSPLRV